MRRERLSVVANEEVGPYTLLRVERGGSIPVRRDSSSCSRRPAACCPADEPLLCAARRARASLIDPIGPGTAATLRGRSPANSSTCSVRSGTASSSSVDRPLLVGGGIGIAPLPYLSEALGRPPAVLGFRSDWHAQAAELVPNAQTCVEPTLVTQLIPDGMDVLACGPEPMLEAVRAVSPNAQLAWEAPMACGYGACYGCAVEIGGELKRLCVEGPVLCAA